MILKVLEKARMQLRVVEGGKVVWGVEGVGEGRKRARVEGKVQGGREK